MPDDPGYRYLNLENRWSGKLQLQPGVVLQTNGAIMLAPALKADATVVELPSFSSGLTGSFGMGVDGNGNLYIADPVNHRILYREVCTGTVTPLPCLGGAGSLPGQLRSPRGILVAEPFSPQSSARHPILYILDSGNHRIQLIDLSTQQLRGIWGQPDPYSASETMPNSGVLNFPEEMVADSSGDFYLLDQTNRTDGIHRIQKLNQNGQVDTAFTATLTAQPTLPQNPAYLAIASLSDREILLILDRRVDTANPDQWIGKLLIYQLDGTYDEPLSDRWNTLSLQQPAGLAVASDTVFIADGTTILLYTLQGQLQGTVPGVSPTISSLSLDHQGRVLVHPGSEGKVLRLISSQAYSPEGSFLLGPFRTRSETPTVWHQIQAIADPLPTQAHFQFYTCTSDDDTFTPDFPPDLDGIQPSLAPNAWVPLETWWAATQDRLDLLIFNQPARYLWIGATLQGDGNSSPVLHQIRLEYNHSSWSQHLPAIYRRDTPQRPFLERTLALFETLTGAEETLLDRLPLLFDPRSAPDESPNSWLDWLASWLDLDLDEAWTPAQRRQAIAAAFTLYSCRGTVEGLRQLIRLYTQATVFIDEPAQHATPWSLGQSALGFTTTLTAAEAQGAVIGTTATLDHTHLIHETDYGAPLFSDLAHVFFVQAYAADLVDPAVEQKLRQILDQEKPAHTIYQFQRIEAGMRVGFQARLGIDAIVGGAPADLTLIGTQSLGVDTALAAPSRGSSTLGSARTDRQTPLM